MFVCNQVPKSGEILMFVCRQKDTKQCCDATKLDCAQCAGQRHPSNKHQNLTRLSNLVTNKHQRFKISRDPGSPFLEPIYLLSTQKFEQNLRRDSTISIINFKRHFCNNSMEIQTTLRNLITKCISFALQYISYLAVITNPWYSNYSGCFQHLTSSVLVTLLLLGSLVVPFKC